MTRTKIGEQRTREAALRAMSTQGYSAAALAREAGLDPGTVGDFLAGKRWPRREKLAAIERALMFADGTLSRMAEGAPGEARPIMVERRGRLTPEDAEAMAVDIAYRMHPGLRRFTDADLIRELQARTFYYAARLTALGEASLTWTVSDEGGDEAVSGPPNVS